MKRELKSIYNYVHKHMDVQATHYDVRIAVSNTTLEFSESQFIDIYHTDFSCGVVELHGVAYLKDMAKNLKEFLDKKFTNINETLLYDIFLAEVLDSIEKIAFILVTDTVSLDREYSILLSNLSPNKDKKINPNSKNLISVWCVTKQKMKFFSNWVKNAEKNGLYK